MGRESISLNLEGWFEYAVDWWCWIDSMHTLLSCEGVVRVDTRMIAENAIKGWWVSKSWKKGMTRQGEISIDGRKSAGYVMIDNSDEIGDDPRGSYLGWFCLTGLFDENEKNIVHSKKGMQKKKNAHHPKIAPLRLLIAFCSPLGPCLLFRFVMIYLIRDQITQFWSIWKQTVTKSLKTSNNGEIFWPPEFVANGPDCHPYTRHPFIYTSFVVIIVIGNLSLYQNKFGGYNSHPKSNRWSIF